MISPSQIGAAMQEYQRGNFGERDYVREILLLRARLAKAERLMRLLHDTTLDAAAGDQSAWSRLAVLREEARELTTTHSERRSTEEG